MITRISVAYLLAGIVSCPVLAAHSTGQERASVLGPKAEGELREAYLDLIRAENAHDLPKVRGLFARSPDVLLVAKTRTAEEGGWAGFWGTDTAVSHIGDLFGGVFSIAPDLTRERVALVAPGVAETYVPVQIAVGYAGQSGTPKPFLMIIDWVRVGGEWKIMTDIAVPVPQSPPAHASCTGCPGCSSRLYSTPTCRHSELGATVYLNDVAAYPASIVRGQERDDVGYVFGLRKALQCLKVQYTMISCRAGGGVRIGLDRTRGHGIDTYVASAQLRCQMMDRRLDRPFADGVSHVGASGVPS